MTLSSNKSIWLFINEHHIVPISTAFIVIDHLQPKNPLNTDNFTSKVYSNHSIRKKRSKSWDIHFHWLWNRGAQEQLKVFWYKVINNNSYYFTKHHPTNHHWCMCPRFILKAHIVRKLKNLTESNFQNSDFDRVCSWANSGTRPFSPSRPSRADYVPIPFIIGIPLSNINSMYSLTSWGWTLTDSIFIPVTENSCRQRTSWGWTLMDSKSRPLTDRSYKPLAYISLIPCMWQGWTGNLYQVALVAHFLTSLVQIFNCPPWNLI